MKVPYQQMKIDFFKNLRAEWMRQALEYAISHSNQYGEVCADDIHRFCPPPEGVNSKNIGYVFLNKGFIFVRRQRSERKECHHRTICMFRYVGEGSNDIHLQALRPGDSVGSAKEVA